MKPKIGIIPGDPGGIGPELIAKLLSKEDTAEKADILLIGDGHLFTQGMQQADAHYDMRECQPQDGDWTTGEGYAHFDQQTITEDEVSIADVTTCQWSVCLSQSELRA